MFPAKSPRPQKSENRNMDDDSRKSHPNHSRDESLANDPDYQFTKRLPPRLPKRRNDIYVNQKSPFIAQFNKSKTLLNTEGVIYIHGLGAAVNSAVNLALQLKSFYLDSVILEPTTSSVDLVDDYIPRTASTGGVHRTGSRRNSAIHIKLSHIIEEKQ